VRLDGRYGKPRHRRQLYRCVPPNGDRPHRFTEVLPREESWKDACESCERAVHLHEGAARRSPLAATSSLPEGSLRRSTRWGPARPTALGIDLARMFEVVLLGEAGPAVDEPELAEYAINAVQRRWRLNETRRATRLTRALRHLVFASKVEQASARVTLTCPRAAEVGMTVSLERCRTPDRRSPWRSRRR